MVGIARSHPRWTRGRGRGHGMGAGRDCLGMGSGRSGGASAGQAPRVERRPELAAGRFAAEPVRVVVVDARGALAAGLAVAQALGPAVEGRRGAMLVLLSRNDADAAGAAREGRACARADGDEIGDGVRVV